MKFLTDKKIDEKNLITVLEQDFEKYHGEDSIILQDFDTEYIESLKNSLEYFLDCVVNKKSIELENFEKSMITTRILIELKH